MIYISVIRHDNEVQATFVFRGETWMEALDAAYDWLKINRKEHHIYHVYA